MSSPGKQQPLPRPQELAVWELAGARPAHAPRIPSAPPGRSRPAEADGWSKGRSALAPETATRSREDTRRGGDHEISEPGSHTEPRLCLPQLRVGAAKMPGSPTPRRGTRRAHLTGWDGACAGLPGSGLGVGGERTQPDATHSHRRFHRAAPVPARKQKPLKRPPLSSTGWKDTRTPKAIRGVTPQV